MVQRQAERLRRAVPPLVLALQADLKAVEQQVVDLQLVEWLPLLVVVALAAL